MTELDQELEKCTYERKACKRGDQDGSMPVKFEWIVTSDLGLKVTILEDGNAKKTEKLAKKVMQSAIIAFFIGGDDIQIGDKVVTTGIKASDGEYFSKGDIGTVENIYKGRYCILFPAPIDHSFDDVEPQEIKKI